MPVKLPVDLPTPPELAQDAELASLALLEAALHVTAHAIIAENPELCDQSESHRDANPLSSLLTASDMLDKMHSLEQELARYRHQRQLEAVVALPDELDF